MFTLHRVCLAPTLVRQQYANARTPSTYEETTIMLRRSEKAKKEAFLASYLDTQVAVYVQGRM